MDIGRVGPGKKRPLGVGEEMELNEYLYLSGEVVKNFRKPRGPDSGFDDLDLGDEDSFAADPELVSASVAGFRRQLEYLRRDWTPIALSEAVTTLQQGAPLPPRAVAITFDDGHVDNYSNAFPLLREHGLSATIFLSTGYVGGQQAFWFDRIATLLHRAPAGEWRCGTLTEPLRLDDVASRRREKERLLCELKRVPDSRRLELIDELESLLGAHAGPTNTVPSGVLDWAQVREMSAGGIEFGSHAVSHPVLSMQTDDAVRRELRDSRALIEQATGRAADILAYPVGKPYAFDTRVVRIAQECGYRAALAYIDGVNDRGTLDPFALRRISVERYYSHSLFIARLALPRIFV